jgi:hypothetical protein
MNFYRIHSITSQKIVLFIITAMKISNPMQCFTYFDLSATVDLSWNLLKFRYVLFIMEGSIHFEVQMNLKIES